MKTMFHKQVAFEIKEVNLEKGMFSGYASVFGNIDAGGDVMLPGAFKKTLQEHSHRVKILWQHDRNVPIGKPVEMNEDEKGLFVVGKVSETQAGKDALILLRDGVINEMSIGYQRIKETFDRENGITLLNEVKLWEFSLVTWAMNELATVGEVKNFDLLSEKQIESLIVKLQDHLQALRTEPPQSRPDPESAALIQSVTATLEDIKKSIPTRSV